MAKVFVIGTAGALEMDALKKAMSKVGLRRCKMWGCVGRNGHAKRVLTNLRIFKMAARRAKFVQKKCPKAIAVGFASGLVRKSSDKGKDKIASVAEIFVIGEDKKNAWVTVEDFSETADKKAVICKAIVTAFKELKINA